jgi:glucosamine--fructose-6-phosphate aminotransferase (isomerizing)
MNKFLEEILEQPQSLRDTLRFYEQGEGKELLNKVQKIYNANNITNIIFTGMGSSFFTSYTAFCLLNEYTISSQVINTSELLHYHGSLLNKNTLLVCVSQSGESYEVVELLNTLSKDIPCVGVSNEKLSTLANHAPAVLLSKAGPEEMTSTKTFVATSLVMLILCWALAGRWNQPKIDEIRQIIKDFENFLKTYLEWTSRAVEFLGDFCFLQIIGRGPSYSTAMQGALMFKEAARKPAEGILGGEFRHGPMEMVDDTFKAIVFAPLGKTFVQSIKIAQDIVKFGGKVILITNSRENFSQENLHTILVPKVDEILFSIVGIVPLQFIINEWALGKGFDPGHFIRGAKVTTIE